MIHKLKQKDYEKVRPLFSELSEYNCAIPALLDGINAGWVLVNSSENPQAALAYTVEGYFLAGDFQNETFVAETNAYLREDFYNDEQTVSGDAIHVRVHPKGWADKVAALFHPREPLTQLGRHYLCTELKYTDWRECLPDGFTIHRVDNGLLQTPELTLPDHIHGWITKNWGTLEHFLKYGFGFCAVYENAVTHWSIADCVTQKGRCEIGIQSVPAHRRRGLAAITAAASVEYALANGFFQVGWQCADDNLGSIKTAEKVGFYHERTDTTYYCMLSSVHHLAERGWYYFRQRQFQEAVAIYKQLFALTDNYPNYLYHVAALANAADGNPELAIQYLSAAIDRGWVYLDYTTSRDEFEPLHDTPEWEAQLARLKENSHDS